MELKEMLKVPLAGGLLLVGCGSSPSFDWESYVNNFWGDNGEGSRSRNIDKDLQKNYQKPAIYGIGGFTLPLEKNRIGEIINPIVSRMGVSDYAGPAFCHWPEIMDRIKEQYMTGSPIILIGHSAGCRDVIEVANVLEKANVPVGVLLLDATHLGSSPGHGFFKPEIKGIANSNLIPRNVYGVENYVTNGPLGGRNLRPSDFKDPFKTTYNNYFINVGHLDILEEKYSDRYVESINRILEAYKKRKLSK